MCVKLACDRQARDLFVCIVHIHRHGLTAFARCDFLVGSLLQNVGLGFVFNAIAASNRILFTRTAEEFLICCHGFVDSRMEYNYIIWSVRCSRGKKVYFLLRCSVIILFFCCCEDDETTILYFSSNVSSFSASLKVRRLSSRVLLWLISLTEINK